ncbi:MAG: DUF1566 domain-containing protein [Saprospiraceae bacterium]|nr:DUF1566 domain-containing protein [Saprospiraceae bacterium]
MKTIFNIFILTLSTQVLVAQSISKTIKRLPDTGQTKSYTDTYGEDNDYSDLTPYYMDNGDGTITDTITGLMWQKIDGGEMTIENAKIYVENLSLGGYDDWRLPTALEAYTIQNLQFNNPSLDIIYFPKTNAEYWWTSDVQANDINKIWVTNAGGGIGNHLKTETISAGGTKRFHARAVRNTFTKNIIERFKLVNEQILIDSLTGLMWQRLPYETALSWENAIKHAENLSIDQYSDWRLPNIKELQSLQDVALTMPCINTSIFPNVGVKKYWSSTSQNNQATRAWYFDTSFGITTQAAKNDDLYIICVRNNTSLSSIHIDSNPTSLHIFPNPSTDRLYICRDHACETQDYEITSINGVNLQSGNATDQIDISSLSPGLYILTLRSKDGTFKHGSFIKN